MKPLLPPLALAFALAASAASTQALTPQDATKIQPGTYAFDTEHTQVAFTVSFMGFSDLSGTFSGASGTLTLDPKVLDRNTLKVTVPVASVISTGGRFGQDLRSAQWLDAAQFPDMTFVSTKVVRDGADKAEVSGDLTLHGVTKPIVLAVNFLGAGTDSSRKKYTVGFEAKGEIQRSAFGVTSYLPMIGDTLHLTIAGSVEK